MVTATDPPVQKGRHGAVPDVLPCCYAGYQNQFAYSFAGIYIGFNTFAVIDLRKVSGFVLK